MSESKYKYNQGDRVYFSMGDKLPKGWAKVCGSVGSVGPVLIIELEEKIDNYPYTHFYIVDAQVTTEPLENGK